jgi:hypothetical protein
MSTTPDDQSDEGQPPWYVYDRHADLLYVAPSLPDAEAWAFAHWDVVEVGDREEVTEHDYWYLLFATKPNSGEFHSRDFQARIVRRDRVIALGRDPDAAPRYFD